MIERIKKIRRALTRLEIDTLLVKSPSNIFYLSGFSGHDSMLAVFRSSSYLLTDFRYEEQARKVGSGLDVISGPGSLYEKVARLIKSKHIRRAGFESNYFTVREKEILSGLVKVKFVPLIDMVETLRMFKDAKEIEKIKRAASITRKTFKIISGHIKAGACEKEIACKINFYMSANGSDEPSFDTIVLSGANSSMPHGRPSEKKIRPGEPVMVDFGAKFSGYSSDLTRMVFVGKISQYINIIYSIVYTAQRKTIEKIRPGVKISSIDKVARSYISEKGFEKYFGHATGHGIGIDIHEFPRISIKNHISLKAGMVFSVEPGIYIPGKFGVRVEDMVLVTDKGCEVLTR